MNSIQTADKDAHHIFCEILLASHTQNVMRRREGGRKEGILAKKFSNNIVLLANRFVSVLVGLLMQN